MYKYQCDKGSLAPIFEDSGRSVFDEATARINSQSSAEDVLNVLLDVFKNTTSATPLYDQLVAGEFNDLQWKKYYEKLKEISQTESVGFADELNEAIKYLEAWYDSTTDSMKKQAV